MTPQAEIAEVCREVEAEASKGNAGKPSTCLVYGREYEMRTAMCAGHRATKPILLKATNLGA